MNGPTKLSDLLEDLARKIDKTGDTNSSYIVRQQIHKYGDAVLCEPVPVSWRGENVMSPSVSQGMFPLYRAQNREIPNESR